MVLEASRREWPPRFRLFGVPVSRTDYVESVACILRAAERHRPALVTAFAAHGVVTASEDRAYRQQIEDFHLVSPDGQPVRHALNLLYGAKLTDRVYGPELTLRLCAAAAERGVPVYLYGSTQETVSGMRDALLRRFPALGIVGAEPSAFRALTPDEDEALVARINESGAGILFVGLGCPRQEHFAYDHRESINAVQVCVGAAFDFIAGTKPSAPKWMQDNALEWLFRLIQEPRRLFWRYSVINAKFVLKLLLQAIGLKSF